VRTTLTLDADVASKAKKGAAKLGKPYREVINAALRIGLDQLLKPPAAKPYRTHPRPMGLRRGFSYDNVAELIARVEGEDHP
jgi:mRNA-degrading endonuclease RelE of RelBE toxin-antitoxin system